MPQFVFSRSHAAGGGECPGRHKGETPTEVVGRFCARAASQKREGSAVVVRSLPKRISSRIVEIVGVPVPHVNKETVNVPVDVIDVPLPQYRDGDP